MISSEEDLDLSQDLFKPRLKPQSPQFKRFDLNRKTLMDQHKVIFKDQLDEAYKLLKRPPGDALVYYLYFIQS